MKVDSTLLSILCAICSAGEDNLLKELAKPEVEPYATTIQVRNQQPLKHQRPIKGKKQ